MFASTLRAETIDILVAEAAYPWYLLPRWLVSALKSVSFSGYSLTLYQRMYRINNAARERRRTGSGSGSYVALGRSRFMGDY